jgi:hypothetical protein
MLALAIVLYFPGLSAVLNIPDHACPCCLLALCFQFFARDALPELFAHVLLGLVSTHERKTCLLVVFLFGYCQPASYLKTLPSSVHLGLFSQTSCAYRTLTAVDFSDFSLRFQRIRVWHVKYRSCFSSSPFGLLLIYMGMTSGISDLAKFAFFIFRNSPRSSRRMRCWRVIGRAPTPCFCTGGGCETEHLLNLKRELCQHSTPCGLSSCIFVEAAAAATTPGQRGGFAFYKFGVYFLSKRWIEEAQVICKHLAP